MARKNDEEEIEFILSNVPAGRETDTIVSTVLMDVWIDDNPEEWSEKSETWFWVHPRDGVLIGEPYHANALHDEEPPMYSHSWRKFEPSTSIVDAWKVLEKFPFSELDFDATMWSCALTNPDNYDEVIRASSDLKYPYAQLAICRATLLYVHKFGKPE